MLWLSLVQQGGYGGGYGGGHYGGGNRGGYNSYNRGGNYNRQ